MITNLLSNLNWLHVVAAAIAYFILGAVWYSPVLFSKPWVKMLNINMNDPNGKKGMGAIMVASFILMFVVCTGLAIVYQIIQINDLLHAVKFGLFFSVCFGVPAISISYLYQKKPLGLHMIDGGYLVAGFIVASIILVMWK